MKKPNWIILVLAVLVAGWSAVSPALADVHGEQRNGWLRYYDSATLETVDVVAPVTLYEEFSRPVGTISSVTDRIIFSAVNSGTFRIVTDATSGVATVALGAADDDDAELVTPLVFWAGKSCAMEARVKISAATVAFNVGFTDTMNEVADKLALMYSGTTLTSTSSNAAVILGDADATTDNLYCASVNGDADGTTTTTGVALAADTWYTIRVECNEDGDVDFYLNGNHIYQEVEGISTHVPLGAYVGFIRHENSATAAYGYIDYIRAWQNR